ncbi:gas vesicle protein [Streptomyces spiroverticillatus]|uniref:Gas vesicle protein n=1 Tax=Streptomyces finlayi TaxID=67296 RepID=A0A918WZ95_9ACTN|nr:GvpL/GvpF family gas vesicle protein [Streptomyces finlayi]GHA13434.1 gas vesicle protein [Streptomyces spiroverticillatus]GHC97946.1 gas vesicle protein [Streptomyces finlayi]
MTDMTGDPNLPNRTSSTGQGGPGPGPLGPDETFQDVSGPAELRYVYAVTRPFEGVLPEEGGRGLDGEPPRLLHHEGLVAVVSPVPAADFDEAPLKAHLEDLDWLAGTARTHQAVVTALTAVTTPLPLRLATLCRDDDGVRRLLEDGRARFVRALERLDGRVEWGVKVYAEAAPKKAAAPVAPPSPDKPGAGRSYLQQRLAQKRSRETESRNADALCRTLHTELSQKAEAAQLHRLQDGRISGRTGQNVLNAAYLVPRADSEAFVEQVQALSPEEGGGVTVELTGPWAPYSFTGIGDEEGTA